jgi:mannose-6-phosphate isomerase class I
MKFIYQRAGAIHALLGPPAGGSNLAMKTLEDSTLVYFFLAFIKAMDSSKPDSFVLFQSLPSIFYPTLQFQTRPRGSYNISFQLTFSSSNYFSTPPIQNDSFILLELSI